MLKPLVVSLIATVPAALGRAQLLDITPPGAVWARATSVSDDGSVVAGSCAFSPAGPAQVFLWSASSGHQFLPYDVTQSLWHRSVLLSGDGQSLAITTNGSSVVWRQGAAQNLTCATCGVGSPYIGGINQDGTRLAGWYNFSAASWTAPGGAAPMGSPLLGIGGGSGNWAEASSISNDGLKVAGRLGDGLGNDQACVWDSSGSPVTLQLFPWPVGWPTSISGDGNFVAGNLIIGGGVYAPVRWSATNGLEYLCPPGYSGWVLDTNLDGSVVVGETLFPTQWPSVASMWSPADGMVDLNAHLPTIGILTTGWILKSATAVDSDGRVIVGCGTSPSGINRAWVLRLPQTVAVATPVGVGCTSSGGPCVLSAATLPWVETTFESVGSGLPTTALVLTLTSLTAVPQGAVPLSLAFAQAGYGCDVLVAPDILGVLVTTTGIAQSSLFLPNTPPLVGVTFYHQMVPLEIDPAGAWTSVTATNALQLTAGVF